jgi:hypothetical protein
MKPPLQTNTALYVLYFYMHGLASVDDVLREARLLDDEQLTYFKLVSQISYSVEDVEAKVLPLIGRLS